MNYLEQDIHVPSSLESTAIGAAITAGLGSSLFSIESLLQMSSSDTTVFQRRNDIFNPKDQARWREFLRVLLDTYN